MSDNSERTYRCWIPDDGETVADAVDVSAMSVRQAAEEAGHRWYSRGRWGGESIPAEFDVAVLDEKGVQWLTTVEPEYDVDFYASRPLKDPDAP